MGDNTNNLPNPLNCSKFWPDNIVDIKCGYFHTLVLTSNREVYSCGGNYCGELGIPNCTSSDNLKKIDTLSDIIRIECGYFHSMFIDCDYNLFICGRNFYGQLGLDDKFRGKLIKHSLSNIIDISSGGNSTFVKTTDNEIYAFGSNKFLELGVETNEKQVTPIQILQGNEDIWHSRIYKSTAKSARFIQKN